MCNKWCSVLVASYEDSLFHVFSKTLVENCMIHAIEVCSSVEFPKNICNDCSKKQEKISSFIEFLKNGPWLNKTLGEPEHAETSESGTITTESTKTSEEYCRICLCSHSLTFCEKITDLMQLFHTLTENGEVGFSSTNEGCICNSCVGKLEEISAFTALSLSSDEKLNEASDLNEISKPDYYFSFNQTAVEYPKLEPSFDGDYDKGMSFYSRKAKYELTDVADEKIDSELAASTPRISQEDLEFHPQNLPEMLDPGDKQSYALENELEPSTFVHTEERPYKCECCEKNFKQSAGLRQHMLIHTEEKPYKCNQCEKTFARSSHLKRHLLNHSDEKPHKCDRCDRSFTTPSFLMYHIRTHTGEKPYNCDYCEKSFVLKCQLRTHSLTHTGEKPHKCEECGKTFTKSSYLTRHVRSHTGEKPYKCKYCEKSFSQTGGLQQHLPVHTGEKPYKCNICEKRFNWKQKLQNHLLTHTGEKPHKCNHCGKSFIEAVSLKKHMRAHSGEEPFGVDT